MCCNLHCFAIALLTKFRITELNKMWTKNNANVTSEGIDNNIASVCLVGNGNIRGSACMYVCIDEGG